MNFMFINVKMGKQEIATTHKVLSKIRPAQFKRIARRQAQILQADEDATLKVQKHGLSIDQRRCGNA
jgi:hypothetical protein